MCDIGRFEYHWIEGDDRLRKPLEKIGGIQQPVSWPELISKLCDRLAAIGAANPDGVRFLLSAHASHEELFLFRRLVEELMGRHGGAARGAHPAITISWRYRPKLQPEDAKFKVPPVEAPNVNGARMLGLTAGEVGDEMREADVSALRTAVESGRVSALYVFDPGPEGSLGNTKWISDARTRETLPLLIVQGVQMTDLARAADFVLPGASYVEKEAAYTNDQGRLQGTARAIAPPGDAMEDWQILVNLGIALGVPFDYPSAADIRADIAQQFADVPAFGDITTIAFSRRMQAKHWLQASNPSERWKWDFMFQDLLPVKGSVDPTALPLPPGAIALKEVK
jgi:predicted molibdopterin-dependent oxidoreductase YjgC